jgi:uncharacterized protein (TIGR02246 family)
MKIRLLVLALGLGLIGLTLSAQEKSAQKETPKQDVKKDAPGPVKSAEAADEIKAAIKAYVEAFNKHDHAALGAMWSETGVYTDKETGVKSEGREAIQKEFEELFKEQTQARLAGEITDVRFIKPDVALIEGQASVSYPGEEPGFSAFSAVMIKSGDKWLLDSVSEADVPLPPTSREALAELEFLIGSWQDDSKEAMVSTQVRWSPGEAFLIRSFVAQLGDEEYQGTQVIGYDPAIEQIRSWSFYSDGSFGDAVWSKNGDEWIVKGTHRLADGSLAAGTQVITVEDENTLSVQLIAQSVDGEPAPSSEPIKVVRMEDAPAEKEKPAAETKPAATGAKTGAKTAPAKTTAPATKSKAPQPVKEPKGGAQ